MDRSSEHSRTKKGSGRHKQSDRSSSHRQKYNIPYLLNESPGEERPDEIMVDVENEPDTSSHRPHATSNLHGAPYTFFSTGTTHGTQQKPGRQPETKHKVKSHKYKCAICGQEFSSRNSLEEQYVQQNFVSVLHWILSFYHR